MLKPPARSASRTIRLVMAAVVLAACDGDGTGPDARDRQFAKQGGDEQIAATGQLAVDPLRVVVSDAATEAPIPGAIVQWSVISGRGATLTTRSSLTDSSGVAATRLRVGPDSGTYRVRATTSRSVAGALTFRIRAITDPPVLLTVLPGRVSVGDTITLTGDRFSTTPGDNVVLFGGIRGLVVSATVNTLRVQVPPCLPDRTLDVRVLLGPLSSAPLDVVLDGNEAAPLMLEPGQARTVAEPESLGCLVLPGDDLDAEHLVVLQNASDRARVDLAYRLVGITGDSEDVAAEEAESLAGSLTADPARHAAPDAVSGSAPTDFATAFERRIRRREAAIPQSAFIRTPDAAAYRNGSGGEAPPVVGDRREFEVFNRNDEFTTVTAVVRHVSSRAVFYEDENTPAGGLGTSDFIGFGDLFDNPVYPKMVDVFGQPSDIDGNDRILVLFTPVVNELTGAGASGFVAGFFFGNDLTTRRGSNRAEIFYSVVPDPEGLHGDPRMRERVLEVVPPVLAHEFQHMIHFNQRTLLRGAGPESLWLSEGLAHAAEDIVGDVFANRGDAERAADFKVSNFSRVFFYLEDPGAVSLISPDSPGSLAERGAAWLYLRYLQAHYGGENLLGRLTRTTRVGVSNVEAETGRAWGSLFADWSTAIYADDAPWLAELAAPPEYTIPGVDLRALFSQTTRGFPLDPRRIGAGDFDLVDVLPAASAAYYLVGGAGVGTPRNLRIASDTGAALDSDAPAQLTVMRLR